MAKTIDARGRSCPEPVIMTKNALDENPEESFDILVDVEVAVENVTRFAKNSGYKVDVEEDKGYFILHIQK
ncbi:preprotein translocase subunit TatB [Anaerosalibacter bizertensis]|uniref:Preprotein translocase subunit TatB n=1 Tax=Anaerosalibacter bizertensis TaxID=932217 RepID=A0A844FEC5_9FIRM|nr:sulfurtransferase TusA family protein [Anaerosalibacter bizertensis]MBV1817094.1 sulfurtransferase TusA family protein [Bacteroidales bacterium MSK.15.36]HHV27825.1 preprotein translocase subunit TatB [Tissierellia bacterium]MBU5293774.1 sulfurtransferase TusA family protein [Anaerosalibacter bizertensis]MCB5558930.1 sulfurtransferase TusA family protein [Anaerosalibacter bizertensis]MCG4564875.1 sulfurtransferase TusA family protein [Anaerosalibacter bizertensis]